MRFTPISMMKSIVKRMLRNIPMPMEVTDMMTRTPIRSIIIMHMTICQYIQPINQHLNWPLSILPTIYIKDDHSEEPGPFNEWDVPYSLDLYR